MLIQAYSKDLIANPDVICKAEKKFVINFLRGMYKNIPKLMNNKNNLLITILAIIITLTLGFEGIGYSAPGPAVKTCLRKPMMFGKDIAGESIASLINIIQSPESDAEAIRKAFWDIRLFAIEGNEEAVLELKRISSSGNKNLARQAKAHLKALKRVKPVSLPEKFKDFSEDTINRAINQLISYARNGQLKDKLQIFLFPDGIGKGQHAARVHNAASAISKAITDNPGNFRKGGLKEVLKLGDKLKFIKRKEHFIDFFVDLCKKCQSAKNTSVFLDAGGRRDL